MEAKLALARAIAARSHGEEAADAADAHFTRVVREGQAPDEVPDAALPEGDPVHLPALLASAFGLSTSEARRLIAQGGVKAGRQRRLRARSSAWFAGRRDAPGGQAALREAARNQLTAAVVSATVPRPPERVGVAKSPSSTNRSVSRPRSDTISITSFGGLWRESEAFLRRHLNVALVFENSTACVYVETSWSRGLRPVSRMRLTKTSSIPAVVFDSGGGRHFELKLEGERLPAVVLTALPANNSSRRV